MSTDIVLSRTSPFRGTWSSSASLMGQPRQAGASVHLKRWEFGNGNNSDNVYDVKDNIYDVKDDDVDVLGNDDADESERENTLLGGHNSDNVDDVKDDDAMLMKGKEKILNRRRPAAQYI